MPLHLAIVVLAAAAAVFPTDTTVTAGPGTRLQLRNLVGDIDVRTWNRDAVRVRAAHSPRERVLIERRGSTLVVGVRPRPGAPGEVDYQLVVPRGMPVSLDGARTSAKVRDLEGDVVIQTISGEIAVQGGDGNVTLSSIQGTISVVGSRGRLEVNSVDGEVRLMEIAGRIFAETVNGAVALRRVVSDSVEVSTINGDLCYDGAIAGAGHYRFRTHNGDITVGLPEQAGATVTLATYRGEIDSDFPLRVGERGEHNRFRLRLGDGRAHLDLESFSGAIRLRRPGADGAAGWLPCRLPEKPAAEKEDKQ
jgi:DUF4097 and DUF4098 domain-containing protein YvlB